MLVRCGALWRRRRGAPSWLLRDPDTGGLPALDIDYAGGRAFKGSVVDLAGLHTVSRASGGYAQNLDGSLTWFGNNVMRRTDRGVLVEGARTNLLLRSQEFENAAWSKVLCTALDNQLVAPNGLLQGSIITDTSTSGCELNQAVTVSAGATVSVFRIFKRQSHDWARISVLNNGSTSGVRAWFNLATGATGTFNALGAGVATAIGMRPLAGGWYLCWVTCSIPGETIYRIPSCSADGDGSLARINGATRGEWGVQFEAAAFPSSYIPTGASTATRASDRVTLDPSFIGGEGTFVAETFGSAGNDNNGRMIGLGAPGQVAAINRTSAANIVQAWNGAQTVSATMGAGSWEGVVRAAIAFSPAGRAICGNAGGVATDAYALGDKTSLAVGSQSTGAFSFYGYIRRLTYFDRRISNAGLQALTA